MLPAETLDQITRRFEYLEARLAEGAAPAELAGLMREYSALRPVADQVATYRAHLAQMAEAEALAEDPEMRALALEEARALRDGLPGMEEALRLALLPKDAADERPAILEIRPGTGGEEAALFAADLLRMYQKYAEAQGWRFDILSLSESDLGGIREVTAHVRGRGRLCAAEIRIGRAPRAARARDRGRGPHPYQCRDRGRPARGRGGRYRHPRHRHPDRHDAVLGGGRAACEHHRLGGADHPPAHGDRRHLVEKSQHQNRAMAMQVLRARLYDMERLRADEARAADRRAQVGTGDRSERIRTYNFPQGRMTDHRINLTLYALPQILAGDLSPVIEALAAHDRAARLAEAEGGA
jgi:peptide chain release factor 1